MDVQQTIQRIKSGKDETGKNAKKLTLSWTWIVLKNISWRGWGVWELLAEVNKG